MNTNLKSGSHLYRRGWLGLIPLIGVFVGLVLLILAIFKYKDKKLMVIGIACILFTFLIYSLMDYRFEYSKSGKNEKAQFVINDLNRLVIEVEFYKLQNKSYPDSLEQLYKNDKNVFIYDILSVYMLHRKLHKFIGLSITSEK